MRYIVLRVPRKRCLVIGGGSDIGSAVVRRMAEDYDVQWTYFNTERPENPGESSFLDITDPKQISGFFDRLETPIDVIVTAAMPFLESGNLDMSGYLTIEPFLRGHFEVFTRAARVMSHGGKIINMLGQCVERGLPGAAFYSSAFAAIENYAGSLNGDEGKKGIIAMCNFLLGPVDTREWSGLSPEIVARYRAKVQQFISTAQVANMVHDVASWPVMPSTIKVDAYYGY